MYIVPTWLQIAVRIYPLSRAITLSKLNWTNNTDYWVDFFAFTNFVPPVVFNCDIILALKLSWAMMMMIEYLEGW